MQHLNRENAVFIHRVAMVEIAQDQRIDRLEFRNGEGEQAQRMHGAQRVGGVGQHQDFAQMLP